MLTRTILTLVLSVLLLAPTAQATPQQDLGRGMQALQGGRLADAKKYLTTAIESGFLSDKNLGIAHNARGIAREISKELDGALADFERAVELLPDDAISLRNRGRLLAAKRDFKRAFKDLDRAIELNPKEAMAYYDRGVAFQRWGKRFEAEADFRLAYSLAPDNDTIFAKMVELNLL